MKDPKTRAMRALGAATAMLAVGMTVVVAGSTPVGAAPAARVTTDADGGPGSFRAAVEAANADPSIGRIVFDAGVDAELTSSVVFTGSQALTIEGHGAAVSGAEGRYDPTWDGGLFVSTGGSDRIVIDDLAVLDSFNNGLAVFLPEDQTGTVKIVLSGVTVSGSQFHGVLVDGQAFDGFNTDDVPHPNCVDPHFVDSEASIDITVLDTTITGSGRLAPDFDLTLETGCPQDYDGLRVDDGGLGDITASLRSSHFDANLADGVELDETGEGSVRAEVSRTSFDGNGATVPILNEGEDLIDLDDGFDIDEAGPGDMIVTVSHSSLIGNFDEGLDLDEAGEGDAVVRVLATTSESNEDENIKVDEEDDGSLVLRILASSASASSSQDGVQATEAGDGDSSVRIVDSVVVGNDKAGVVSEQGDGGTGVLRIISSDLSGNADGGYEVDGVSESLVHVAL